MTFHCSGQLRPGFLGIVQRFRKCVPVTGSESDHLFLRQDLLGSFLSSAEQESAYRHPCRRGRPDNQFLDFRRCAQINAFVGLGSSRHDRVTFITEEVRLIVVQCEAARNSNRTIDVLVAKIGAVTERREMFGTRLPSELIFTRWNGSSTLTPATQNLAVSALPITAVPAFAKTKGSAMSDGDRVARSPSATSWTGLPAPLVCRPAPISCRSGFRRNPERAWPFCTRTCIWIVSSHLGVEVARPENQNSLRCRSLPGAWLSATENASTNQNSGRRPASQATSSSTSATFNSVPIPLAWRK